MGEALERWEEAWFGAELPARQALSRCERQLALARHEEEAATPDALSVARAHRRFMEAHLVVCQAQADLAHEASLEAAGTVAGTGIDALRDRFASARDHERAMELDIRDSLPPDEAAVALEHFD